MQVFIVKDDDTGECRVFKNRKSAINTMYCKCKKWNAILYTMERVGGFCQYALLSNHGTEKEQLEFLYQLTADKLCDVFEQYYSFQECELEN